MKWLYCNSTKTLQTYLFHGYKVTFSLNIYAKFAAKFASSWIQHFFSLRTKIISMTGQEIWRERIGKHGKRTNKKTKADDRKEVSCRRFWTKENSSSLICSSVECYSKYTRSSIIGIGPVLGPTPSTPQLSQEEGPIQGRYLCTRIFPGLDVRLYRRRRVQPGNKEYFHGQLMGIMSIYDDILIEEGTQPKFDEAQCFRLIHLH